MAPTIRFVLASLVLLCVGLTQGGVALAHEQRLKVVELFTSQGCSSCPTADRLLGELATRTDVLPLSVHVDYWDYLGWRDPFASVVNTQRQRDYARHLSVRYVYTPQIVVQGTTQVAGNDRDAVLQAISNAPAALVPISLAWQAPGQLVVLLGGADSASADILIISFDRSHITDIAAGENRGRELLNFNVLRGLSVAGQWHGQPSKVVVDLDAERWTDGTCAVLVQSNRTGAILGAARCGH